MERRRSAGTLRACAVLWCLAAHIAMRQQAAQKLDVRGETRVQGSAFVSVEVRGERPE